MPTNRVSVTGHGTEPEPETKFGCCYASRLQSSVDDFKSPAFWKALTAEYLGTLILVMISLGSTVQGWQADTLDVVQISLAFGFSVASAVWTIGHVSGGHINPAVTIAMFATRRVSLARFVLYVIFQTLGAMTAAILLKSFTPDSQHGGLGVTSLSSGMTQGMGVGVEFSITFFLVLTVFAACDSTRTDLGGSAPLAIGFSVAMGHLWAVEYTGSSMNPARSFGPALAMDSWTDHWVYWVGPMGGGLFAGLLYDNLFASNACFKKTVDFITSPGFDNSNYPACKPDNKDSDDLPESKRNGVI